MNIRFSQIYQTGSGRKGQRDHGCCGGGGGLLAPVSIFLSMNDLSALFLSSFVCLPLLQF
jgi:hypothetical protein